MLMTAVMLVLATEPVDARVAADGGWLAEVQWAPLVDVFGEYGVRLAADAPASNAFSVPRAQLGVGADWRGARAKVLLEGVYASQGGTLVGVAGNSVVVRMREAAVGYRLRFLEAQLGLLPTLVIPETERAWLFRELAPDALESQNISAPADFGVTLRGWLPKCYGWLAASVTNGEGYSQTELNTQKNVELAAAVHPRPEGFLEPLTLYGSVTVGSTGPAAAKANRYGGGVLWAGPKLGGGVMFTAVDGWRDDGGRRGLLLQAFLRGELFEHLLLAARMYWFNRDVTVNDQALELLGAVGVRFGPAELFAAVSHTFLVGLAQGAVPGREATELRAVARFRWPRLYDAP